ncbi:ankyrin repeat domain-containing protein [Maribacter forsetii]|uniref:ankyrin repeat domain-containing protein n=1 Tax=Maribacter forsetii TaxID=444515 RepID=UPI000568E4F6|nr:ankyrin repeat domain-containing protein [Maribacter forsetii]
MNEFFFKVIREGSINEVKSMLEKNPVLVNSKDARGSTPLILATYYDQKDIAILLLDKGAKIDAVDASGNTALMGVCFKGYADIAKMLIENNAKLNERNAMGATCLIYAAQFNRLEIAKLLIANGADKTIKDNRGNSAFDHAKTQGLSAFIDMLE